MPLIDPAAHWDLLLIWQRGRAPQVLRTMIDLLAATAQQKPGKSRSLRLGSQNI